MIALAYSVRHITRSSDGVTKRWPTRYARFLWYKWGGEALILETKWYPRNILTSTTKTRFVVHWASSHVLWTAP